jgi:glycosyl transferase family 1
MFKNTVILCREMTVPAFNGAMLYSNQIIKAMAKLSKSVNVICMAQDKSQKIGNELQFKGLPKNTFFNIHGWKKNGLVSIVLSNLPVIVSRFETSNRRRAIENALALKPDCIIFNHIMSICALDKISLYAKKHEPFVVYCSHNFEYHSKMSIVNQSETNLVKKFAHYIDAKRIIKLERKLFKIVSLLSCISQEDEKNYNTYFKVNKSIWCPAGYEGHVIKKRDIDSRRSRNICIVGSFVWTAKKNNIISFLRRGYDLFLKNKIGVFIVGNMSDEFKRKVQSDWPGVTFTGRVKNVRPYLEKARIGVIPEKAGGGFKLKSLEYIFNRLPLFALEASICNLNLKHGTSAMLYTDMKKLCEGIVEHIDNFRLLNTLQINAFEKCQKFFGITPVVQSLEKGINEAKKQRFSQ